MEKLGIPQTHLGLKEMIKKVDEDQDDKSSLNSVLHQLYSMLVEIDVSKEGVGGAKNFFEAKVNIDRRDFVSLPHWVRSRSLRSKKAINFNVKFGKNRSNGAVPKRRKLDEKSPFRTVWLNSKRIDR